MLKTRFSTFYINSIFFVVLSLGGAVMNYALYPVLARILSPEEFGNFAAVVALSNQILAILLAFNIISIYLVKNYPEQEAREKAQIIQKVLIWFFIAVTLLVLILSPLIRTVLKVDDPLAFIILVFILLAAVPAVIWTGYLQGHKRLVQVGVYSFSGAFFKFILAVLFGVIGGTIGSLYGVLMGTLLGILVLKLASGIRLPRVGSIFKPLNNSEKEFLKSLFSYVLIGIVVVGGLGFMQNIDIIFAKALFDTNTAGVYSGISILSNGFYYIAFLLVWIILPEINPKDRTANKRILKTAYKLLGVMGGSLLAIEILFEDFLAVILLGQEFAGQGQLLIYATLFQMSLVAVVLYAYYLLIMRNGQSFLLSLSVISSCLSLPWVFGDSPKSMIISLWIAVMLGFGIYYSITKGLRLFSK